MSADSPPSSAVTVPMLNNVATTSVAASPTPSSGPVSLRVYHEGEKPRNGRLVTVSEGGVYPTTDDHTTIGVSGAQMFAALSESVDLNKYTPHIYCSQTDCFVAVQPGPGHFYPAQLHTDGVPPRLDVRLISRTHPSTSTTPRGDQLMCDSNNTELRGAWFGIGIVRGKVSSNHGTLWRTALQLGASYTFTLGRRYDKKAEGAADVYKSHRQMPCFGYESVSAFAASAPVDAQWVAIEYGGQPLAHFRHPKRAVYILGSEDAGLPPSLVARAHHHVSIPVASGRPASLNVAAAGAIVLWDRMLKISAAGKASEDMRMESHQHNTSSSHRHSANGSNMSKRFSAPTSSVVDDDFDDSPVSPGI